MNPFVNLVDPPNTENLSFQLINNKFLYINTNNKAVAIYRIKTENQIITEINYFLGSRFFLPLFQQLINSPLSELIPYCEILKTLLR